MLSFWAFHCHQVNMKYISHINIYQPYSGPVQTSLNALFESAMWFLAHVAHYSFTVAYSVTPHFCIRYLLSFYHNLSCTRRC